MKIDQQEAFERAFAGAIEFAKAPVVKSTIALTMSDLTGQTVTRQMVGRWLHPDPATRNHPGFGIGLLLLMVCNAIEKGLVNDSVLKLSLDLNPPKNTNKNEQ